MIYVSSPQLTDIWRRTLWSSLAPLPELSRGKNIEFKFPNSDSISYNLIVFLTILFDILYV